MRLYYTNPKGSQIGKNGYMPIKEVPTSLNSVTNTLIWRNLFSRDKRQ